MTKTLPSAQEVCVPRTERRDEEPTAAPTVEVRGLVVRYGPHTALHGVDMDLSSGEVVGLLGVNGAGKSTLIRRIAGLLPSREGTVRVAGRDPATDEETRALIGYLPEQPPMYPEETVWRYVGFMASLAGVPRRRRRAAVQEALERAGADRLGNRLTGQLSKGQRQRVGLAATIVHEPAVLLLDEPADGLDPPQIRSLRKLLRELSRTSAVLVSTHILSEAQTVCDRVVILDQGRVVADQPVRASDVTRFRLVVSAADPQLFEQVVKSVPGVVALEQGICTVTSRTVSESVARAVVDRGWGLQELTPVGDDLESVFLKTVAGGVRP